MPVTIGKVLDSESRWAWLAKNRTIKLLSVSPLRRSASESRQLTRLISPCWFHLSLPPHSSNHSNPARTPTPIIPLKLILRRSAKHFLVHISLESQQHLEVDSLSFINCVLSFPIVFLMPHFVVLSLPWSFFLPVLCLLLLSYLTLQGWCSSGFLFSCGKELRIWQSL